MKGGSPLAGSNFKNKYKERVKKRTEEASTVRKIVAIIVTVFILVITIGGLSGYFYVKSALEPVDPDDDTAKDVEIPLGSSTSEIASILEENNIIKNDLIFRFYTKFNNESGFQAGDYQFTQSMKLDEVIETLKSGKLVKEPAFKVTVPEGQTLEQIAAIYAEQTDFTKEEFMKKVNDEAFVKQLIKQYPDLLSKEILKDKIRYPLEGYLFAATYPYYVDNPTIEQIVNEMLEQTQKVVLPYKDQLQKIDAFKDKENVIHEAVTMASLLENEARTAKSRKMIASVFYNRLQKEMPLQTDPTVAYAHGEHLKRTMYDDLEIDSPYNTYEYPGLPIGPISNFNKNALEAVANPSETDYLYFLADSNGEIHYAKTLEKHNEYKQKYISDS